MANPTGKCLPWWHNKFKNISTKVVPSGCSYSSGRNLKCTPEEARAFSESWLKKNNLWNKPLPLATYSMARHITSEVGSGTIEEMVAVGEACINQAKARGTDVNQVLVYNSKGSSSYGYYGKIGSGGIGRWASTANDPRVSDIYLADFILRGGTGNFNKGALDQNGPDSQADPYNDIRLAAKNHNKFWVGHLPGVNPWHTLQYKKGSGVDPEQTIAELQRLISWKGNKTIAAQDMSVCSRFNTPAIITGASCIAILGGLFYLKRMK